MKDLYLSNAFESIDPFREQCLHYDLSGEPGFRAGSARPGYTGGIPLWYDRDRSSILVDQSDQHCILFGSSGSKKTRDFIMPMVNMNADSDESMIIHDPKGEIYRRCGHRLEEKGFRVVLLDFRTCDADCWNPLTLPARCILRGDDDEAYELANDIATTICTNYVSEKDPFWDYSAQDVLFGLIITLLAYIRDHHHDEEDAELGNLFVLRYMLFEKSPAAKALWNWISEVPLIRNAINGTFQAATDTQRSTLAVLDSKLRPFRLRPKLVSMLANNTFEMEDLIRQKTAVFLCTPDERVNYNSLISLFVSQSYQFLINYAASNGGVLPRRVTYVLDEFSSLPPIGENGNFTAMIAAARSRGIRYVLAVQSYAQLESRYREEAATIVGNCGHLLYLFSRENALLRMLSELCGEDDDHRPNLSIYDLQQLETDTALLLAPRLRPAIVDLLDVDQFPELRYYIPDPPKTEPKQREPLDFHELIPDPPHPSAIGSTLGNPFGTPFTPPNPAARAVPEVPKKDIDLDALIAKIDKRIEELEQEEKQKQEQEQKPRPEHPDA